MRRTARFALVGLIACSVAAAQPKPSAPDDPPSSRGQFTAPSAAAPGTDKFGLPLTPPAGATLAAPPATTAAPSPTPPADEPETVRTLRALLGPDAQLSYGAAEVIDPARGAVRLRGVVLERPNRRVTVEELTLDGLREDGVVEAIARELVLRESNGTARIAHVRVGGLSVQRPAPGEELRPDMLSLASLRLEGLSVEGATPVAIAQLSIEDYGIGRSGRVALEGLEVRDAGSGPVDRISLGRMTLRGLDLAASLAATVAEETPPRPAGAWALEMDDVALAGGGRPVGGLGALHLSGEAATGGAESGRLTLRNVRVEPFPGLTGWLQRFGYAALVADLTAETRYDRSAGRLELTSLSLAGRDIGAIGFSMMVDGVTPEAMEAQDLDGMRLISFSLRYLDQSLYSRFVRQQARQTRQSEQQVRQQLAAQAEALTGQGGNAGATAAIRTALQRFLRGEARELEITARPPEPLPFSTLPDSAAGGPAEVQRLLGLTATAR